MKDRDQPRQRILNKDEDEAVALSDDLVEFEKFRAELLPALRADVMAGTPAKDILEKVKSIAAARLGLIAASSIDQRTALSAIKDILDRTEGRAQESKEITHKFGKLKDEELDSLLASRFKEIEGSTDDE